MTKYKENYRVTYEAAILQYLCMTSIAEGCEAPVDVNILDLVDTSKDFSQTAKTAAKPEKFSFNRGLKIYG